MKAWPFKARCSCPELEVENSYPYNVDCDSPKDSADSNEHHSPRDKVPSNNASFCDRVFCSKIQAYECESNGTRSAGIPRTATSDYPYDAASDIKDDYGSECDKLPSIPKFAGTRHPTDLSEHHDHAVFHKHSNINQEGLKTEKAMGSSCGPNDYGNVPNGFIQD